MTKKGPKMAPRWPQDGPNMAPRWPPDGPKMALRWLQEAPRWRQDGPKMASRSFKMQQQKPAQILGKIYILAIKMLEYGPKMTPRWP